MAKIPFFSIATVLCWILLLLGTLTPRQELPGVVFEFSDKLLHFLIFMAFTTLFLIAGHREGFLRLNESNLIRTVFIVASATAAGTEVLQHFVPGRMMSFADVVANMLGVLVGCLSFKLFIMLFGPKR